jgi:SAM-dependent methyltransferase
MGSPQARPAQHAGSPLTSGRLYERIGGGYTRHRRADPRIAAQITRAIGDASSVVNVGAGTGSYEPAGRRVVAAEPSAVMLDQRDDASAPAVRAVGESLPFPDDAFDVALAVLTIHHWSDPAAGLRELQRVAPRQVIFHFEPGYPFWVTDEYVPALRDVDDHAPSVADVVAMLGTARVEDVAVPHDCTDGFFAAYWRRPEAYLDPAVRANISNFARTPEDRLAPGLDRLRADLDSGDWDAAHRDLLAQDELDGGYRLIVAG